MPQHSKPQHHPNRAIALIAVFALAFTLSVIIAANLRQGDAPTAARTVCACTYNVFHICVPWHPPLVCYPI